MESLPRHQECARSRRRLLRFTPGKADHAYHYGACVSSVGSSRGGISARGCLGGEVHGRAADRQTAVTKISRNAGRSCRGQGEYCRVFAETRVGKVARLACTSTEPYWR